LGGELADTFNTTVMSNSRMAAELEASNALPRESREQVAPELAATQRLQATSTQLILEHRGDSLHEQILDAAVAITRSDFASIQMFHAERGEGELRLLDHRGFTPEAARHWAWVPLGAPGMRGMAVVALRDPRVRAHVVATLAPLGITVCDGPTARTNLWITDADDARAMDELRTCAALRSDLRIVLFRKGSDAHPPELPRALIIDAGARLSEIRGLLGDALARTEVQLRPGARMTRPAATLKVRCGDVNDMLSDALALRLADDAPSVRVVMFSGHIDPGYIDRAVDCGA